MQPTERDDTIESLRQAVQAARDEAAARSTFLATVSHEIRDPMNSILGMARLLQETPLDQSQERYADAIVTSAESLLTIINDILDISKVDAGKLELVEIDFDVRQFFDRLQTILSPRSEVRGLKFAIEIDAGTPDIVRTDPGRLRQVLINLCSNSIKFTETGAVTIQVAGLEGAAGAASPNGIAIIVTDTGPGIPPELQNRLFTAYAQADASIPRLFGGSGLGLMIVERLVQAMGGAISVRSEMGEGTEFTIDLPVKAIAKSDAPKHRGVALSGSTALVIEAEERVRTDLDALLGTWKVLARMAVTIEQGTVLAQEAADRGQPFDVILIDSDGREHDALQMVTRLRGDERLAGSSVVIMASSGLRGDAARAATVGADAYITKPLNAERLQRCLQSLANWDRQRDGIMTVHTIEDQKTKVLNILVVDDNALNCRLAQVLLERAGHKIVTAENGQLAVKAIQSTDFDIVLMDLQMPVMNGYEATEAIRALPDEIKAQLPIVAVTANAMNGEGDKCQQAGMNGYVTKPINGPDLLAAVDQAVYS